MANARETASHVVELGFANTRYARETATYVVGLGLASMGHGGQIVYLAVGPRSANIRD